MVRIRRLLNRWERERGSLTTPPYPQDAPAWPPASNQAMHNLEKSIFMAS